MISLPVHVRSSLVFSCSSSQQSMMRVEDQHYFHDVTTEIMNRADGTRPSIS